ncbi:MAG: extracellular solute-binding protein [Cellulomonas sp.]|nr:extracellular solute-binding protein [Cellulomonas sp.]
MSTGRKKLARAAAIFAAVALTLTACSSGGDKASAPASSAGGKLPTGQTLSVWTFGATGLEDSMNKWAADTGNKVEFKKSEFDPHHEQLLTALASGAVPDVAVVETSYSSLFKQSAQYFTDLRDFGADSIKSDYLDWRWAQGVADDGRVFGLPTDVGGLAMAYRTDLFTAAGLPTDAPSVEKLWSSWEDFLKVGEEYKAKTGKSFLDSTGVLFQTLYNQSDPKLYSADGKSLVYDTNPQIKHAFEIAARGSSISAKLGAFSPEWNTAMAKGDYAVQLAPAWMLNYIQGQAPETSGKWSVANLPVGGGNWGGSQLTIPKASKNAALAYDMISKVLSPANQLAVFKATGNFPSTPSLYTDPALTDYKSKFFSDAPVGIIYSESAKKLKPVYEGPKERQMMREFGNALGRIDTGDETAAQAWDSALAAVKLEIG